MAGVEVKFRCDERHLAALERLVSGEGQTRSAVLNSLIMTAAEAEPPARPAARFGDDDDRTQLSIRLNRRELAALEGEAAALGIRRSDMLKKLLRGQLYKGDKFVVLSAETKRDIKLLTAEAKRIGGMVNRIETKVNVVHQGVETERLSDHIQNLTAMRSAVVEVLQQVEQLVTEVCAEEHRYWRGSLERARERREPDHVIKGRAMRREERGG